MKPDVERRKDNMPSASPEQEKDNPHEEQSSNSSSNMAGSSRQKRRQKRHSPPVSPAQELGECREFKSNDNHQQGGVEVPPRAPLTDEKAKLLAMMTARMHEGPILRYMRKIEVRELLLAVPVDAAPPQCSGMLDVMLGMVVHCEASENSSTGWAIGTIVSPREIAEQQGGFRCIGMRPMSVEVRSNRFGDELEFAHSEWEQVKHLPASSTQTRLRQKALLNRLKSVRMRCDTKTGR
jgi:hypothetical protein